MKNIGLNQSPLPSINAEIDSIFASADYTDSHSGKTTKSLTDALAAMIRWQPFWLKGLYGIRTLLAPVFGYRIVGSPHSRISDQKEIPFTTGEPSFIGKVWRAEQDTFWSVEAVDRHLSAILLVLREPEDSDSARLSVLTAVFYRTWRGKLYLRLVMLFHRAIVRAMLRAAK